MTRTTAVFSCGLLLVISGCSQGDRLPAGPVDCSVLDGYEFRNISDFSGNESGWFQYADPTPGGYPDPDPDVDGSSNVPVVELEEPGRCGDQRYMKLEAGGLNFWGAGFGDWAHNQAASRADGTGYEGVSFWARSPAYAEKTFLLNVDDGRTIKFDENSISGYLDLNGDGVFSAGDVASGTECRLPPPVELGEAECYRGGVSNASSAGSRVPVPDECGNAFHTWITTTESWQLFLIPWSELVQWPCPNRLEGGINPADIAKFEVKFGQGTTYELWIDNIAFYRRRADAGS